MIIFSEKDHVYKHLESGNKLSGWTSLIKNYTDAFDSDLQKVASAYSMHLGSKNYSALKFGRYKDYSLEDFVEYLQKNYPDLPQNYIDELNYEWNYSAILGSEFHSLLEKKSYDRGWQINPYTDKKYNVINMPKKYDNQSLMPNLYFLKDGYYPELLVWDYTMGEENTPVTMIDDCFIETIDNDRFIDIDDKKTNSKIYNSKDKKMKGVLADLYDNTEEKYKLQACFGAKLMSTHGFIPRYCGFTHYKEYNENKSKLYLAKYDFDLMDKFQEDWKRLYKEKSLAICT